MKHILNVAKREVSRIASSKTYIFMLFILPVTLFLFLSYIYSTGVVRDIPVAVCDSDNGELSRTFISFIESTGSMKIVKHTNDEIELKEELLNGRINAAFVVPDGFEENIKSGKPASIIVYNNTMNLITGNTVLKDASTFIKTMSAGILLKKIRAKGLMESEALNIINPVKIDTKPLYNPNYNYLTYLVPGLIPVMLQMIIMLLSSILISSEFSANTFKELLESGGYRIYAVVIGKSLPHIIIYISVVFAVVSLFYPYFKIELYGSLTITILFFVLFVISSFFYGLFFSCLSKNYLFTTEISLFFNTPAFIFSGFIYPLWAMPEQHTWFAQLMPFTHFIDGYLKIAVMSAEFDSVMPQILRLSLFTIIPLILVFLILKIHKKLIVENKTNDFLLDGEVADV